MVVQSAGNLATTQSIVSLLQRRCLDPEQANLMNMPSMYEAATLLGGQIKGEDPRLFHIYPQGNFIEATQDTLYLIKSMTNKNAHYFT